MRNFSLVQRISLSLVAAALIGGLAITLIQYSSIDDFEDVLLEQSSRNQLNAWIEIHRIWQDVRWPETEGQRVFHFTEASRQSVPPAIQRLHPGRHHEVDLDGKLFDVTMMLEDGEYYVLAQDIDRLEEIEDIASLNYVVGMLAVVLIMFGLVYWASRRVVSPVAALANEVQNLKPEETMTPLSDRFQGEEVSQIARAVDSFRQKLSGFIERERTFTAAASHELRTPLAVIASSNELLQAQSELSATSQQLSHRIARSSRQMEDMITSLLFLARESGVDAFTPCVTKTDATRLVREAIDDHRELTKSLSVNISDRLAEGVVLSVEASHLRMILNNLLRNAVSHTRQGSIEVFLDNTSMIVTDTGSGIEPALLKRVFQRNVSDWQNQGLGFGLYLCKQLIDRYGWTLEIESDLGQGTRVIVSF